MGGAASCVEGERSLRQGLGDLPESCVASVLVHLDPLEICGVARLNRAFRGAAAADMVWGSKLPENYGYLLEKAEGEEKGLRLTKKEIYARLSQPIPFDGGSKVFWLEKYKGGVCMLVSSKALAITGIDDRRYWNRVPTDESRFRSVAYLQQIWWFEVDGEIDFHLPVGRYSLFYRLHLGRATKRLGRRICNSEHVHGWDAKPVRFQLSTSCGQRALTECYLGEQGIWNLYRVGDFVVGNPQVPAKVKFSMTQIDCTHTKGGVCVDAVLVCPRGFRPEKAFH